MRLLITTLYLLTTAHLYAQKDEWIAPEGKILNYRTLTWNDFQDKEDKEQADRLAERNLQAAAYVSPAIYFKAEEGTRQDNGRIKFRFTVKCAFQSKAFVRESTKQEKTKSYYVLTHEQDHYDIALNFANKLQRELSGRDYSEGKYNEEIDKLTNEIQTKYAKTQETYDHEVNPGGENDVSKQRLWDMRIRKCYENNTDEFYGSEENVVQTVRYIGQTVKRIPGEPALQFAVRARPLYADFPAEMTSKIIETKEWTPKPSIIAFYTQQYFATGENEIKKDNTRTPAYVFIPNGKDTYKRVLIDSFSNEGRPVKIAAAFFANADSDNVKELVIMATSTQKDKDATGTLYINKVYDNTGRLLPGRLKKLDEASSKIEGGMEGIKDGKPVKAKFKTEKEVIEGLKKMGYN